MADLFPVQLPAAGSLTIGDTLIVQQAGTPTVVEQATVEKVLEVGYSAATKTTPIAADTFTFFDSVSSAIRKLTWTNLLSALGSTFAALAGSASQPFSASTFTGALNSVIGMKNRIINGGFIINQRGYVSAANLGAGGYGHDRWKGGAAATNTYTFTQGALGVNTLITITAGTLVQVIEGCNLAEGGTYVLSWTGTAQGRLNGGTYSASGSVTVTGWVAGTNLPVEFNTGTVGNVQLETGSVASSFDYRDYGREFIMCQRYYEKSYSVGTLPGSVTAAGANNSTAATPWILTNGAHRFKSEKRATPIITIYDTQSGATASASEYDAGGTFIANRAAGASQTGTSSTVIGAGAGTFTSGNQLRYHVTASADI